MANPTVHILALWLMINEGRKKFKEMIIFKKNFNKPNTNLITNFQPTYYVLENIIKIVQIMREILASLRFWLIFLLKNHSLKCVKVNEAQTKILIFPGFRGGQLDFSTNFGVGGLNAPLNEITRKARAVSSGRYSHPPHSNS